jgi:hypothetical protein
MKPLIFCTSRCLENLTFEVDVNAGNLDPNFYHCGITILPSLFVRCLLLYKSLCGAYGQEFAIGT